MKETVGLVLLVDEFAQEFVALVDLVVPADEFAAEEEDDDGEEDEVQGKEVGFGD